MGFVAVYDANVLYPSSLRDVLIRVAQSGLVQAKWTDSILDEVFRNLKANRPDLDPIALARTRELMGRAVLDWKVKGYEPLVPGLTLPDPDDRHVLAAAIRAKAQVIVTYNLRDFPEEALSPWDIEAVHPDSFLEAQIHLDQSAVYTAVHRIADSWRNPPGTVADVLQRLENLGLVSTVAALRSL
ncbi:PIN domain-containing protein [Lolliginicoccus levis]|uniref:PIN domain-containing protein n=1 Tax=Lolliginicoccus levis TaxID=2919542 RepID=UPI00241EB7D5|nr:PIN domain-containing protein [Lolliginicoccus levis]